MESFGNRKLSTTQDNFTGFSTRLSTVFGILFSPIIYRGYEKPKDKGERMNCEQCLKNKKCNYETQYEKCIAREKKEESQRLDRLYKQAKKQYDRT